MATAIPTGRETTTASAVAAPPVSGLGARVKQALRADSAFWRRALQAGVTHGPEAWVRYSPPVFGWAFGAALQRQRESVRATLRQICGPRPAAEELRDVASVFANFASSMTDAMLCGSGRGYYATNRPVNDWYFLSSLARGRGVIMATAHTAGWDVGGHFIVNRAETNEVLVLMEAEPNAAARELSDAARMRTGVRLVHVGDDALAPLPLLRHLRKGGILALKFDRMHAGMRTREVTFLGAPWRMPEGPLRLAALTGAAIVPVFTRRIGFLEYELHNYLPITLSRRPSEAELDEAAQTLANCLESFVRAYPTQWFRFDNGQ